MQARDGLDRSQRYRKGGGLPYKGNLLLICTLCILAQSRQQISISHYAPLLWGGELWRSGLDGLKDNTVCVCISSLTCTMKLLR